MKFYKYIAASLLAVAGLTSCGDSFLEDVEYSENLDAESAAEAAGKNPDVFLNGLWSYMVTYEGNHDVFGYMSVMLATNVMSEDIALSGSHWFIYDYQFDNRMYNYRRTSSMWTNFYTYIAKANEIISLYPEGAETVSQKGLLGQAYAERALSYYYLIQLYQFTVDEAGNNNLSAPGVPLMYTTADGKTEEEIAAAKGRNTVGDVFAQIESDITKAIENLEAGYERPNKNYIDANVAHGIAARYYLLSQQWAKAAEHAAAARKGYTIMSPNASGLYDGFKTVNNEEWMWGFAHTTETQTAFASFGSHMSNYAPGYCGLGYCSKLIDARLYDEMSGVDARKKWFNGPEGNPNGPTTGGKLPYANLKFGHNSDWTENYLYMRAAEMVLIEAEAYAHLSDGAKAATTLKELMSKRDAAWNKSTVTVDDVYLQRRLELWGEGFSFFDLKRLNKGVDRSYEGNNHLAGYAFAVPAHDKRWRYQIPQKEIQENKLINEEDQNE